MTVTMSVLVVVWVTGWVSVSVVVVVETLLSVLVTVGRKQIPFHGSVQGDGARKAIYSQYMHMIPQTLWQTHL